MLTRVLKTVSLWQCFAALAIALNLFAVAQAATATRGFSVSVNVKPAASMSLSSSGFTWSAARPSTPHTYVESDRGPITITGTIRTAPAGGAGSIVILSPGDLTGLQNSHHTLSINNFALMCSGNGNSGTKPVYAAAYTPLKAKSSVSCATWGAGASTRLNFTFDLLLQTQGVPSDTYNSSGFSIIATAT